MKYEKEKTYLFVGLQDLDDSYDIPLLVFRRNLKVETFKPVIQLKKLVVKEIEKVASEWSDVKKHDGYIMMDVSDNRKQFGVNYPYADDSFSQLGTVTAERIGKEVEDSENERIEMYSRYTDAEYVLSGMAREILKESKKENLSEEDDKLLKRLDQTYKLISEEISKLGFIVTAERHPTMENWVNVKIIKKEE